MSGRSGYRREPSGWGRGGRPDRQTAHGPGGDPGGPGRGTRAWWRSWRPRTRRAGPVAILEAQGADAAGALPGGRPGGSGRGCDRRAAWWPCWRLRARAMRIRRRKRRDMSEVYSRGGRAPRSGARRGLMDSVQTQPVEPKYLHVPIVHQDGEVVTVGNGKEGRNAVINHLMKSGFEARKILQFFYYTHDQNPHFAEIDHWAEMTFLGKFPAGCLPCFPELLRNLALPCRVLGETVVVTSISDVRELSRGLAFCHAERLAWLPIWQREKTRLPWRLESEAPKPDSRN